MDFLKFVFAYIRLEQVKRIMKLIWLAICRKIPLISPGLIELRKGDLRGLISGKGGGGLITGRTYIRDRKCVLKCITENYFDTSLLNYLTIHTEPFFQSS